MKSVQTKEPSIDLELKKKELEEKEERLKIDKGKLVIDKIDALRHILGETVIDEENNKAYSEGNKYKQLLDEGEMEIVKDKLFELIKML